MTKYLKLFTNYSETDSYESGTDYIEPYVSLTESIGGGVNPRYNVPSDTLCILMLKDGSTLYIKGENTINREVIFPYHEDIIKAKITDRCTTIGQYCFVFCSHLLSVTIPNSVTTIGETAFGECKSLSSVTIPDSITNIKNQTFYDCTSLEHITLPNSLKEIGEESFFNCGLKELIIPEGVNKIDGRAISSCFNLESITLPSSLKTINGEGYLGKNCDKLRAIKIYGKFIRFSFNNFNDKTDLTLYVDPSLVNSYKEIRDQYYGRYKVLPLEN